MNFKDLRQEYGYQNQDALAQKLNISRTTISMWESGHSFPTVPTIHQIANLFNIKPENVFSCFIVNDLQKTKRG